MPIIDQAMLKSAESGKTRKGKNNLVKYLNGGRITRQQAIQSKCYDCMGMGEVGECEIKHCSLHAYSPYSKKK